MGARYLRGVFPAFIFAIFIFSSFSVPAAPPTPHGVAGWIFNNDSSQVPLGTGYDINDTNSSFYLRSATSVPITGYSGRYSEVVNGQDNDIVLVRAWNSTDYGKTSAVLIGDIDDVNVTLNLTRGAEPNMAFVFPLNGTLINISTNFTVNASITLLGHDGYNCNATINFSNESVVNLSQGSPTIQLGTILLNETVYALWNSSAHAIGNSLLRVSSECSNVGEVLEANTTAESYLEVVDNVPPVVSLVSPLNNTIEKANNTLLFVFTVSDDSPIANCSLFINSALNSTNSSVQRNVNQSFSIYLGNDDYSWMVQCTDDYSNAANSPFYNLSVQVYYPSLTITSLTNPLFLISGSTAREECNLTISDGNGFYDIKNYSASLFHSASSPHDSDDNNYHYTNNSCLLVSNDSLTGNYSCTFDVEYYADNGTWFCYAEGYDNESHFNATNSTLSVPVLYSLSAPAYIDFGEVSPGGTSNEVNATLINYGNAWFNVSVDGYAVVDGDGIAMNCSGSNISLDDERYSVYSGEPFSSMTSITDSPVLIPNLSLYQRTDDSSLGNSLNLTFWRLLVPQGISRGGCSGVVVFRATI